MSKKPVKRVSADKQKSPMEILVISGGNLEDGVSAALGVDTQALKDQNRLNPFRCFRDRHYVIPSEDFSKDSKDRLMTYKLLETILGGENFTDVSMDPTGGFYILSSEQISKVQKNYTVKTINFEDYSKMNSRMVGRIKELQVMKASNPRHWDMTI